MSNNKARVGQTFYFLLVVWLFLFIKRRGMKYTAYLKVRLPEKTKEEFLDYVEYTGTTYSKRLRHYIYKDARKLKKLKESEEERSKE